MSFEPNDPTVTTSAAVAPHSSSSPWPSSMVAPLELPPEPYRESPALFMALHRAALRPERADFTYHSAYALYDFLLPLQAAIPRVPLDDHERQQLRGYTYYGSIGLEESGGRRNPWTRSSKSFGRRC